MKQFVVLLSVVGFVFCGHDFYHGSHYEHKYGNDDAEVLEYPCAQNDRPCARKYLSPIFDCNPIHVDQKPGSYVINDVHMNLPYSNMSFTWRNALAKGFDDYKRERLYINKKTGTLVYEATLNHISIRSPKSTMYFYRKGKEPVVTEDFVNLDYRDISLTLTVYNYRDGKHAERHLYPYFNIQTDVSIGPKFTPNDPTALKEFALYYEEISIIQREAFVGQAPEFFLLFLNTLVCDILP